MYVVLECPHYGRDYSYKQEHQRDYNAYPNDYHLLLCSIHKDAVSLNRVLVLRRSCIKYGCSLTA